MHHAPPFHPGSGLVLWFFSKQLAPHPVQVLTEGKVHNLIHCAVRLSMPEWSSPPRPFTVGALAPLVGMVLPEQHDYAGSHYGSMVGVGGVSAPPTRTCAGYRSAVRQHWRCRPFQVRTWPVPPALEEQRPVAQVGHQHPGWHARTRPQTAPNTPLRGPAVVVTLVYRCPGRYGRPRGARGLRLSGWGLAWVAPRVGDVGLAGTGGRPDGGRTSSVVNPTLGPGRQSIRLAEALTAQTQHTPMSSPCRFGAVVRPLN
jgi:hypothetical protein